MMRFGALTLLASHGNAGEHFARAGDIVTNWGGGDAPFAQWAGLPLGEVPAALAPLGVVLIILGVAGLIGVTLTLLRNLALLLFGGFATLLALLL